MKVMSIEDLRDWMRAAAELAGLGLKEFSGTVVAMCLGWAETAKECPGACLDGMQVGGVDVPAEVVAAVLAEKELLDMEEYLDREALEVEVVMGDGKVWRCLAKGCGGSLELVKEQKEGKEERWGCLLCGKQFGEGALVKAAGKVI